MSGKRTRTEYIWNMDVYREQAYLDSSNVKYCLKHMATVTLPFLYQFKTSTGERKKGEIDIVVSFNPHCYTRSRNDNDIEPSLVTDHYSDGSRSDRVFDQKRYNYSLGLIKVIKNLSHKVCRSSRVVGKAIRLEDRDRHNPRKGVYIIMKLRRHGGTLRLYVETAHERNNEPYDAQLDKAEEKYMLILGRYLRDACSDLIDEPEP